MLSEAQRRVLERLLQSDAGWLWFGGQTHQTVRALERMGFASAERRWRFGGWQYFVRITEAGRKALENR